jgi:pyrimidine deaminase RibD-like protein
MPVGTTLRAQVSYSARSVGAVLIEASVSIRGSQWRVVDADLHATMMALADAFRETQGAAFAEALA